MDKIITSVYLIIFDLFLDNKRMKIFYDNTLPIILNLGHSYPINHAYIISYQKSGSNPVFIHNLKGNGRLE